MKSAYKAPVEYQKFTTLANELGVMAVVASKDGKKLVYCKLIARLRSTFQTVERKSIGLSDQFIG